MSIIEANSAATTSSKTLSTLQLQKVYVAASTYARFYQLGITRESRVIPGISESSVLSTPNLGLFSE